KLELAISTRGAFLCERKIPTGFPLCTIRVSSSSRFLRHSRILSKQSQFLAALPIPPYTTRSSGRSATSGSRLFWIIRKAASLIQFLQCSVVPVGDLITRDFVSIFLINL